MRLLSILTTFLTISASWGFSFDSFLEKFNKNYDTEEYMKRKIIYDDNVNIISLHNNQNNSWNLEINEFTDLSWDEFRLKNTYLATSDNLYNTVRYYTGKEDHQDIPNDFDWVKQGGVSSVKNQGNCGSCWAFSTVGSLEGLKYIIDKKLISLSPQQLVDCSHERPNSGCKGGLMDTALQHVVDYGICSEDDYPYIGTAKQSCNLTCSSQFEIDSFGYVLPENEKILKNVLFEQPISIAIQADQLGFQFYKSGVFDGNCGTNLDHGVLLVGWGEEDNKKYWIIKNSWGATWGENGFIRLIRSDAENITGQCGLALEPVVPLSNQSVSKDFISFNSGFLNSGSINTLKGISWYL